MDNMEAYKLLMEGNIMSWNNKSIKLENGVIVTVPDGEQVLKKPETLISELLIDVYPHLKYGWDLVE